MPEEGGGANAVAPVSGAGVRRAGRTGPDAELVARATYLSNRYLGGHARPRSVRWVDTMQRRWGSCTPLKGTIRISRRIADMPEHVRDYVLLHELAHLLISGHGPGFWTLLAAYPETERAKDYLRAVSRSGAER